MKKKEAWYAVIGGIVGAVLTMAVCSFSPLGAQSYSEGKFNVITCKGLIVEDADGKAKVIMGINPKGPAGFIMVTGTGSIAEIGGTYFQVGAKGGLGAVLATDEHGGRVVVSGKDGKMRVAVGVNADGNGVVNTWDKNGYRLGTLLR